ncbi:MAG: DUF6776 family protein [Pseudomonadales bacterium]|nr:hypothetical protein [Pseudomonadales bacterium]|tara:strand:- start:157 stop:891 length:735 start_codon:yes stop_codon:yes gene_type:complete
MAAVKGSKLHEMVVVPYRPLYKAMIFIAFLFAMVVFGWLTYEFGNNQGLELKVEVVREKDLISKELGEARALISEMRQEIADLTVGGEIDNQANEEVRQTIENQQNLLAAQNEEISFYKGVMLPNVANKGLRIERLDVSSNVPGRVRYSLLLTQVVDKHDYVQGGVRISLLGQNDGQEETIQVSESGRDKAEAIKFRFRYFQNIIGELQLPEGFVPREVMVVVQSSGLNAQRLEKTFDWRLKGE